MRRSEGIGDTAGKPLGFSAATWVFGIIYPCLLGAPSLFDVVLCLRDVCDWIILT